MSNNISDVVSTYSLKTQNDMIVLNSVLSAKTTYLRRKRRQHLLNIVQLQRKQFLLVQKLLTKIKPRQVWSKSLYSHFWEKDVPEYDDEFFRENFRMSRATFELLCTELKSLEKEDTAFRKSIPLRKRVAVALYTLGTSSEYRGIGNRFGIGASTVCNILQQFCDEAWNVLSPKYLNECPVKQEAIEENIRPSDSPKFESLFLKMDSDSYSDEKITCALVQLKARFRRIGKEPDKCSDSAIFLIKVCCALHNFLTKHNDNISNSWLRQYDEIQDHEYMTNDDVGKYLALLVVPDVLGEDATSEVIGGAEFSGLVGTENLYSDSST